MNHSGFWDDFEDDNESVHEPWMAPDDLADRFHHRNDMEEQARQHKRVLHPQSGLGNILHSLRTRQVYGPSLRITHKMRLFGEYYALTRYQSSYLPHLGGRDVVGQDGNRPSSSAAVSTISIAFSPDHKTMASTHGDHSVKITCTATGRLLQTLQGHPRTPWTVKYHPSKPNIVASGCLGFQVRVWDWHQRGCLQMVRLDYAIISLSFHPEGHILAIASGSRLHFWDYGNHAGGSNEQGGITQVEQRNMLRCVHFPPNGHSIIVGGMNPNPDDPRRRSRGGMSGGGISFYLRLWDFDLNAALYPQAEGGALARGSVRLHRKPLSNPRTVVPRALLYNDGGFDVSSDGKTLCACAEYWLPDGAQSAMQLLERIQDDDDLTPAEEEQSTTTNSNVKDRLSPYLSPPRQRGLTIEPSPEPQLVPGGNLVPVTPPNPTRAQFPLSPPSPPGRRYAGGLSRGGASLQQHPSAETNNATASTNNANDSASNNAPVGNINSRGNSTNDNDEQSRMDRHTYVLDEPSPSNSSTSSTQSQSQLQNPGHSLPLRPPHPLSVITARSSYADMTRKPGRYVPHVVTVSLETSPIPPHCGIPPQLRSQMTSVAKGHRPRLGQLLQACPLDGAKASAVTCVKFAPSAEHCLLGYGVREPGPESRFHPVIALYKIHGGMTHVSTLLSGDDDVNISRFHPDSGYGFVYGTKQGRVRVLSPRPWNYYYSDS